MNASTKLGTRTTALIAVIVALLAVSTAQADTIYVDDDNCPGPGDGSELGPYCSIQMAIDNAVDTDEIVVAPGFYFETINFLGKAIWLHSSDGPDVTVIDAEQAGSVVTMDSGEGSDTVIEGFTIRGGTGTLFEFDPGYFVLGGGGIYNVNSNATVTDCWFTDNTAYSGAGMYSHNSNSTVTGCTFIANSGDFGAGMFNKAASLEVSNCNFEGNTTVVGGGAGGGMYNYGSSPTLTGCTFKTNSATFAGGMENAGDSPALFNCAFIGNTASNNGGGMKTNALNLMLKNCTFKGNTAGQHGGGMFNNGGSSVLINCLVDQNSANFGGGISNWSGGTALTNCTFTGNSAGANGGGLRDGGSTTVTNCIFWNDLPTEIFTGGGGTTPVSYSDVQGGYPGTGNINADPLFVDPDGPDDDPNTYDDNDFRLGPGSPCIDAGDNTDVPPGQDTDLDGNDRLVEDECTVNTGLGTAPIVDMGAYEFQGCCVCDLSGDGIVGVNDFLLLLSDWGACANCENCEADFDDDCIVGITDFLILLAHWGSCP